MEKMPPGVTIPGWLAIHDAVVHCLVIQLFDQTIKRRVDLRLK